MQKFFHEDQKISETLFERLTSACEGLIYISETDAPIIPFVQGVEGDGAAGYSSVTGTANVSEVNFDKFFDGLTSEREWFGEAEKNTAKRFGELKKVLEETLRDIRVFKVGEIRLDVYVIGIDGKGNLAGVQTVAVET